MKQVYILAIRIFNNNRDFVSATNLISNIFEMLLRGGFQRNVFVKWYCIQNTCLLYNEFFYIEAV